MSFSWPLVLLGLVLIPLIVAGYIWQLRRRRRFAVPYASLSLIRAALPKHPSWRRHLPFAVFLLALASLIVGAARPQASVDVPTKRATIILTLDVSLSMCSADVPPSRLSVAEDVARKFIKDQPGDTRIGLVAFSGLAQLVVPPTTKHDELLKAIADLRVGRGTAVGTALLKAVDAIAEVNPNVSRLSVAPGATASPPATAATPGTGYQPDIVVLLTDGATTQGVDPLVAAQQAADQRVRVYTVAFGTDNPAGTNCTREQIGSDVVGGRFGGFGGPPGGGGPAGGGGRFRNALVADNEALNKIAEITGGTFHQAKDAGELGDVFRGLPNDVAVQTEEREISVIFVAVGALAALVAVGLSLWWNRYP